MKSWVWMVLVGLLTFLLMRYTELPLWVYLAILLPLLTVVLVIGSVLYNFRESLEMKPVPQYGYAPRLRELEREAAKFEPLGFKKCDQFYFKTIPDSVTAVFKHESEPYYLCMYHFGQKFAYDIVSRFDRDYYLTTSSTIDSGLVPRPVKALLQIVPNGDYNELLRVHQESCQYIYNQGIRDFEIAPAEFRYFFMKSYREFAIYMKKMFLWPVALVIRTVTRPGKAFCKTIKEQYPHNLPVA